MNCERTIKFAAVMTIAAATTQIAVADTADTADIVRSAMTEIGVKKTRTQSTLIFPEPYIQHNQTVPTGLEAFKGLIGGGRRWKPRFFVRSCPCHR